VNCHWHFKDEVLTMASSPFLKSVEDFMRDHRYNRRRIELMRLRVKDIGFDYRQVRVINGEGGRHRMVALADEPLPALRQQVGLLGWHYFFPRFPAPRLNVDPGSGYLPRLHFDENNPNKLVKEAAACDAASTDCRYS
jgi:integrase